MEAVTAAKSCCTSGELPLARGPQDNEAHPELKSTNFKQRLKQFGNKLKPSEPMLSKEDGLVDFADPTCMRNWPYWEAAPCGFGFELALLLPDPPEGLREALPDEDHQDDAEGRHEGEDRPAEMAGLGVEIGGDLGALGGRGALEVRGDPGAAAVPVRASSAIVRVVPEPIFQRFEFLAGR